MLIVLLDRNKNDVLYNCDRCSGCSGCSGCVGVVGVITVLINTPPNKTKNGQF
jgi:hypothetical protein